MTNEKAYITGRSLVRSTGLNLIGYLIPLLFLLLATPIITSGLGSERYGVLSLVWLIIGYFVIFDLGLGSAATRFVAVTIGENGSERIPQILWTIILVQMCLGLAAGAVLACLAQTLVENAFKIPPQLIPEARNALWITSFLFPISFVAASLSGMFAAFQRFGIVTVVNIANSASFYIASLTCIYIDAGIEFIFAFFLIARALILAFQFVVAKQLVASFFTVHVSREVFLRVASFAGWVSLSNFINPMMFYLDRFLIAALLGMSALTYYSVPFDVAARIWVISTSLTAALLPAFATVIAKSGVNKAAQYVVKSIKFLVLASGPVVCLMLAFSQPILDLWVGADFAEQSTLVLQLLLLSTLFDYPGIIASTLLEGAGRPRSVAIVKIIYLPIHALTALSALSVFGLAGGAVAVFAMRAVYSFSFTWAATRLLDLRPFYLWARLFPSYLLIVLFLVAALILEHLHMSLGWLYTLAVALGLIGVYLTGAWCSILDNEERKFILSVYCSFLGRAKFRR